MFFQYVFTSFKDYYVNANYNFDLFGYKKMIFVPICLIKKNPGNSSGIVLTTKKKSILAENLTMIPRPK